MATASDSIRRARPLLGTFVEIEVAGATKPEMEVAVEAAFAAIATVHRLMSFHDRDSDVTRLNRDACDRPVGVHAWTFQVLKAAVDLHQRSKGLFDVAVAPILQDMEFLPRTDGECSAPVNCPGRDAIELLPRRAVRFRYPGMKIDLGGIAKGFAVDRAIELLRSFNLTKGLVNAGGDLAAFGPDAQTIHIRNPRDPRRLTCSVDVTNEALASTARRFDPFQSADTTGSAVIDPTTGKPAGTVDGVTVRAPSCMFADALTKIVMISGTDAIELLEQYNASALLISVDNDLRITPDWHHAVSFAA
jgi:thiamine biosynthesis lipoprotein